MFLFDMIDDDFFGRDRHRDLGSSNSKKYAPKNDQRNTIFHKFTAHEVTTWAAFPAAGLWQTYLKYISKYEDNPITQLPAGNGESGTNEFTPDSCGISSPPRCRRAPFSGCAGFLAICNRTGAIMSYKSNFLVTKA
jgi:hypothetical protein